MCLLLPGFSALAQQRPTPTALWQAAPAQALPRELRAARPLTLATEQLAALLSTAPAEAGAAAGALLPVPLPDGSTEVFRVWQTPTMAPALAARYPAIRTYAGQSVSHPHVTARFDLTPLGFHAQVLGAAAGRVFIDPVPATPNTYRSFAAADRVATQPWQCAVAAGPTAASGTAQRTTAAAYGTQLLTYRLALACTGEYAVAVTTAAGVALTKPNVLAAMVTAVNRVSGIYEQELAIRLQLIAGNDALIFLDGATDPYTNNDGAAMLTENRNTVRDMIGAAGYDIGHVFSTGGGGIAGLGVVCLATNGNASNQNNKARGVTGLPNPVGDNFYVDYVAHEMGHQFGGNHTFDSVTSNCGGGNRNGSTAMEPGSGTTIMAYAGICGADDLQAHSDPFFHAISQDEIRAFIAGGGSCGAGSATGNTIPTANAGADFTIPKGTPFQLTGAGTDANGDAITYDWEEMDAGGTGGAPSAAATSTSAALFRSFPTKTTGVRVLPQLSAILAGNTGSVGETLPQVARTLNFRLTVRDNRANGGGVTSDNTVVTVSSAGPFLITNLNTATSFAPAATTTVTWSVNSTDLAPISAATVDILFSTDNGQTFAYTLATNTPNDGSQSVRLPNLNTTTGRVRVQASGRAFFDINDAAISLVGPLPVELTQFDAAVQGTTIQLKWATAQELHNAGFEVQARGPGEAAFKTVAFVKGHGSSSEAHAYAHALPGVVPGQWYLRLRQLDDDATPDAAKAAYSPVRAVVVAPEPVAVQLWPNPAPASGATASVYLPAGGEIHLQVHDLLGRVVRELAPAPLAAGLTELPVPLQGLSAGTYFWQLRTPGRTLLNGKLEVAP
ncbi:reprolysin-like metallopeptidase [Hymenobacter daeguensis]